MRAPAAVGPSASQPYPPMAGVVGKEGRTAKRNMSMERAVIPIPTTPLGHARSPALHVRILETKARVEWCCIKPISIAAHHGSRVSQGQRSQPLGRDLDEEDIPSLREMWRAEKPSWWSLWLSISPVSAGKRREQVVDAILSISAGLIRRRPGRTPHHPVSAGGAGGGDGLGESIPLREGRTVGDVISVLRLSTCHNRQGDMTVMMSLLLGQHDLYVIWTVTV